MIAKTLSNQSLTKDPFIEKYQLKIKEQASRLQKLEKYKHLCEKKILQFNPSQRMPIREDDISDINYNNLTTVGIGGNSGNPGNKTSERSEKELKLEKEIRSFKKELTDANKKINAMTKVKII